MDIQIVRKQNKKKTRWSIEDENCLLDLWEKNIDRLRGTKKKATVYTEIADELQERGKIFSPEEIKVKIHNLTNKYKREKRQIQTLGLPHDWPPFQKIHAILGAYGESKAESFVDEEVIEDELSIESECKYSEELTQPVLTVSALHSDGASSSGVSGNSRKPATRRKKTIFEKIMIECKKTNLTIIEERNHVRNVDMQMLSIEKERNEILREFVTNAKRFQDNVTHMLKKIN